LLKKTYFDWHWQPVLSTLAKTQFSIPHVAASIINKRVKFSAPLHYGQNGSPIKKPGRKCLNLFISGSSLNLVAGYSNPV